MASPPLDVASLVGTNKRALALLSASGVRVSGYALATATRRGDAYLVDRLLSHVKANGGVSTVWGLWDVALDKALWGVKQVDFTLFARGRTDLCLPLARMAVAHGGRPAPHPCERGRFASDDIYPTASLPRLR